MKMAKRRLKALDQLGCRIMSKVAVSENPSNRAERRRKARLDRQETKKGLASPVPPSPTSE